MTVHIMLDLETWGTEPGCDLRSVGAVRFNPLTRTVCEKTSGGAFYLAVDNPGSPRMDGLERQRHYDPTSGLYRRYPLHRDPKTVAWWNDQGDAARAAFTNPVDLAIGLTSFADWLELQCPNPADLRLWAHGPFFDHRLYAATCAALNLPVPWHYRAPRDTRTAFDLAGLDASEALAMFTTDADTYHHALDDAIVQARAVCAAWAIIKGVNQS